MEIKHAALVIADISGYTHFMKLHTLSLIHAEQVITDLLESVINVANHPLTLNKLEGDAAFLYALISDDKAATVRDVIKQVEAFFTAFRAKASELACFTSYCPCEACGRLSDLKLKVIVHHGPIAFKHVRQFEELAGEDVILIHRLLKNTIPAHEYILLTDSFYQLGGGLLPGLKMESHEEHYSDVGAVPLKVFYPVAMPEDMQAMGTYSQKQAVEQGVRWGRRIAPRLFGLQPRKNFAHLPDDKVSALAFLVETPLSWFRKKRDTS